MNGTAWESLPDIVLHAVAQKLSRLAGDLESRRSFKALRGTCRGWRRALGNGGARALVADGPYPPSAGYLLHGVTRVDWTRPSRDLSRVPFDNVTRIRMMWLGASTVRLFWLGDSAKDCSHRPSETVLSFLTSDSRPVNLVSLDLAGAASLSDEALDAICSLPSLRKISLDCSVSCLKKLARHGGLTHVRLLNSHTATDDALLALGAMDSLTALHLQDCRAVTDAGFERLGRLSALHLVDCGPLDGSCFGHLVGLRFLRVEHHPPDDTPRPPPPPSLRCLKDLPLLDALVVPGELVHPGDLELPGLRTLKISSPAADGRLLGMRNRQVLAGELWTLRRLTSLDVSKVGDVRVVDLSPLSGLKSLKIAKFRSKLPVTLHDVHMRKAFEALADTLPSLTSLDLSHPCQRVYYCKEALAVVKDRMKSLASLDLSWGVINQDDAMACLASLKDLNLSSCQGSISDDGMMHLSRLELLNLTSSRWHVTDRGVEALARHVGKLLV